MTGPTPNTHPSPTEPQKVRLEAKRLHSEIEPGRKNAGRDAQRRGRSPEDRRPGQVVFGGRSNRERG